MKRKIEVLWFLGTSIFLTLILWEIDGKYGFNPSDEARVLGMVQRLYNGEVPHKDFMYQTFVGSAYLHFFHILVPSLNLQFQRILSILMFQIYSIALLRLSPKFNSLKLSYKVPIFIISSILNMHYFEFTIWPTVDGIFTLAVGSFLIFRVEKFKLLGYFIIGLSPLMKTPFILSTIAIIFFDNVIVNRFNLKKFLISSLSASISSLSYLVYVTLNGGFSNLLEESLNQPNNSLELLNSWIHHLGFYEKTLIPLSILLTLYFLNTKSMKPKILTNPFLKLFILFIVINSLNFGEMTYKPIINLLNLFFIFILFLKSFKTKISKETSAFFVCYAIEVGAIMSIGWRWGLFVSGTVLVLILLSIMDFIDLDIKRNEFISLIVIILIFINPVRNLLQFKSEYIYLDKPKSELTYNLNNLDSRFGNIYTSENVYIYLESIQECLEQYETTKISIFPDNPSLYFIFKLNNPIPVDWHTMGVEGKVAYDDIRIKNKMLSDEYVGSVVFLQSFKVSRLKNLTPDEVVTLNPNPFPDLLQNHYIDVYNYLKSRDGTVITSCNSFTVLINN